MTNIEEVHSEASEASEGSNESDAEDVESVASSVSGGDGDDGDDDDDEASNVGNAGWADSMSKILKSNKPKSKKSIVLSKAKKETAKRDKKGDKVGFEIIGDEDGEAKVEPDSEDEPAPKKKRDEERHPNFRVKPNILEKEREKLLSKIATRGVVQLFNTVRNQQKQMEEKLEGVTSVERKKEKIIKSLDKNKFLDVLMGQTKSEVVNKSLKTKLETQDKLKKESTWDVFRDDFMMGAKMKDWDKKGTEEEEEDEKIPELDSDSD